MTKQSLIGAQMIVLGEWGAHALWSPPLCGLGFSAATMSAVTTLPGTDYSVDLQAGERAVVSVSADGFFASNHGGSSPNWHIVITDRRYIAFAKRGMMKKRLDEVASWPLTVFTERLNTSEGSALGSFMHVLTLFAKDGETVSAGFKSSRECQAFKQQLVIALGPILG